MIKVCILVIFFVPCQLIFVSFHIFRTLETQKQRRNLIQQQIMYKRRVQGLEDHYRRQNRIAIQAYWRAIKTTRKSDSPVTYKVIETPRLFTHRDISLINQSTSVTPSLLSEYSTQVYYNVFVQTLCSTKGRDSLNCTTFILNKILVILN